MGIGLVDFADFIFDGDGCGAEEDEPELDFPKFMDVVLQLRGSNNATVKDVVDLRKFVQNQFELYRKHTLEEIRATTKKFESLNPAESIHMEPAISQNNFFDSCQ